MFASLKQGNDSTDAIAGVCIGQPDTVLGVRYFAQPSVFAGEGATYLGEMVGGVPHGHGTLVQRNGNRFDGDWRSGKRHGRGRSYTSETNCAIEGTWDNGVLRS